MINIIPSLYVSAGKSVGIKQGDFKQIKVYSDSPLDVAKAYRDGGIRRIELIDLEGTKSNSPVTFDILKDIVTQTGLKVNYGGGIKSRDSIRNAQDNGADKIICSTIAATQPNVFSYWLECFGSETMIFGADLKGEKLAVRGRKREVETPLDELIRSYLLEGVKFVEVADIERSGMMTGPAIEFYTSLSGRYPRITVIAKGGVRNMEDIIALQEKKIYNVVVGTAIAEGNITMKDIEDFYGRKNDTE